MATALYDYVLEIVSPIAEDDANISAAGSLHRWHSFESRMRAAGLLVDFSSGFVAALGCSVGFLPTVGALDDWRDRLLDARLRLWSFSSLFVVFTIWGLIFAPDGCTAPSPPLPFVPRPKALLTKLLVLVSRYRYWAPGTLWLHVPSTRTLPPFLKYADEFSRSYWILGSRVLNSPHVLRKFGTPACHFCGRVNGDVTSHIFFDCDFPLAILPHTIPLRDLPHWFAGWDGIDLDLPSHRNYVLSTPALAAILRDPARWRLSSPEAWSNLRLVGAYIRRVCAIRAICRRAFLAALASALSAQATGGGSVVSHGTDLAAYDWDAAAPSDNDDDDDDDASANNVHAAASVAGPSSVADAGADFDRDDMELFISDRVDEIAAAFHAAVSAGDDLALHEDLDDDELALYDALPFV